MRREPVVEVEQRFATLGPFAGIGVAYAARSGERRRATDPHCEARWAARISDAVPLPVHEPCFESAPTRIQVGRRDAMGCIDSWRSVWITNTTGRSSGLTGLSSGRSVATKWATSRTY
jgi:hypothetical protein